MVDSPDKIKRSIENDVYKIQDYDISSRIRLAMKDKLRSICVPYHLCEVFKNELKDKGYRVTEEDSWFFGKSTFVEW